jgi:hypothetical protein
MNELLLWGLIVFFGGIVLEIILPRTRAIVTFHWITLVGGIVLIVIGLING